MQKADQWRRWIHIQPTVLWLCWRDDNDSIPTSAPNIPGNVKHKPTFRRNLQDIYRTLMYLSIAERILANKMLSMSDVQQGQRYIQLHCQELLRLGVHLLPNHHLSMHYSDIFRRFGPAYVWWLFAFERFNGDQESVNINGRGGGEVEMTLIRNWVSKHRLFELVRILYTRLLSTYF